MEADASLVASRTVTSIPTCGGSDSTTPSIRIAPEAMAGTSMAFTATSTWIRCSTGYVFRFDIHIDPVIDGDRCSSSTVDRQRNEMKSITNNSTWATRPGQLG